MQIRLSNGLAMAYKTKGTGRPVILLHPIGTGADFWGPMMDEMADEYRCIAIDLRGHGESDAPPRRFTLDDLAEDVIEMIKAQELKDVVLVGCSYGGMVAQGILLKAPELISCAVLTGTTHQQTDESRAMLLGRADETRGGMAALLEPTMNRWFAPDFFDRKPDAKPEVEGWLTGIDPVMFAWSWEAIANVYYGDLLKNVDTNTLLVLGEHDPGGKNMPVMESLMANSKLEKVPGLGHMAPYEGPEVIAKMIKAFIAAKG